MQGVVHYVQTPVRLDRAVVERARRARRDGAERPRSEFRLLFFVESQSLEEETGS